MRTTTANYDAENAKRGKTPVVIAEFSGVADKFASGDFKNITANHKKVISRMRTNLMSIDILEGKTDFGNTEFDAGDKDLVVSALLKDNVDLPNRNVTVKVGYGALNDTDFVSLPAVQLKDPQLSGPLTWNFRTKDIIAKLDKKIFVGGGSTIVSTAYTSGDLNVISTADFYPLASFPVWMKMYIVVGGEVMAYTNIGTGPTRFTNITRGHMGTDSSDHSFGEEVRQIVGFEDINPMHALLTILLSGDPNNTGSKNQEFYDILTAMASGNFMKFGMDLTTADVDVEQIEEFGWKHFEDAEYCLYLAGKDEVNGLDWLVDNIFKPTGTFPYIGNNGKIRVGFIDWIELNENYLAIDTLATADIDEKTSTPSYKIDWKNFHNVVEFRYGRNSATGAGEQKVKRYKLDSSVTNYFQTAPLVITTSNLVRNVNADWLKAAMAKRWLYFLANPHAIYNCHVSSKKWLLEASDQVDFSYDKFPDLIAGTRGWIAKKSFIQGVEVEWYPEPGKFFVEGRTWELFNKVANFYTITKVTGGGNLGLNADNSQTHNIGDDMRVVLSGVSSAQIFIAFVDLTPPGTATTIDKTVSLGMHLQDALGSDLYADNREYVRYLPSNSTLRKLAFITIANTAFNPDSVKMDWYAASAATADRPTLNFREVWAITLDQNMTEI